MRIAVWRHGARRGRLAVIFGLAVVAAGGPALAGLLDEVWVGGLAHDYSDLGAAKESGTYDVTLEVDSAPPPLLKPIGAPRVNAVVMLNTAGLTNFGALGLTWEPRLFRRLYGSLDFGLGVTDGLADPPPGSQGAAISRQRLLLGSPVLFREAAGLEYRLSRRWFVGAQFVHASNGHILGARHNQGITDAGLRLGYRFR